MRSLEEHISPQELASLPATPEGFLPGAPDHDQLSLHLEQCEACQSLAQTYWTLRSLNRTPAHPAPMHDLLDQFPEQIEGLASATPVWQQRMAARMKAAAEESAPDVLRTFPVVPQSISPIQVEATTSKVVSIRRPPLWITLPAAAVLLLAAVLGGTAIYRNLNPSDERLLAAAYDKNRLSELRIPDSRAVDLYSPTRAADAPHATSRELLQLKLRAQDQFEKTPNDPRLRQTLGEIAIVEHDGESARRQFEMAEALDPKLPRLKFDLGTAYFELAEAGNHPLDYARAIDFFGQYLQSVQQKDPVALFDRGLCWERQAVDTEAIKDFQAALALEKDPAWRAEIQRHLTRLKAQTARDTTDSGPAPTLTPASFLALKSETPGDYENYLDVAGREWLTHRDDPQTSQALQQLAVMGARHNDLWLRDFLAAAPHPAATEALAQALQASARGDADTAHAASETAAKLFRQAANQPGYLRAAAEHVYSLQRMGRARDCLAEAGALTPQPALSSYAWTRVYLQLEIASCYALHGEPLDGRDALQSAADIAYRSRLQIIGLRSSGFISTLDSGEGDFERAWNESIAGLTVSRDIRGTAMRRYHFLATLDEAASALKLESTEAGLADAASVAALDTQNLQIAAYALEVNATKQIGVGAQDAAVRSFANADATLARLGSGAALDLYRADWEADRAALAAQTKGIPAALASMAAHEETLRLPDAFSPRVHFYTEFADLSLKAGQRKDAVQRAWLAVLASERLLGSAHDDSQRPAWKEETDRAYRIFTLALAENSQPEDALRSWEWYRGAAVRGGLNAEATQPFTAEALLPSVPTPAQGALTLVFARLENEYVGWAIAPETNVPPRMIRLQTSPDEIDEAATAFHHLCADPNSSTLDIATLGRALDRDLLAPFGDQIDRSQTVQLDLDPTLTGIPFAAIERNGSFLGTAHSLIYLTPGWSFAPQTSETSQDRLPPHPHILIVRGVASTEGGLIPAEYDESSDIVRTFSGVSIETANLQGLAASLTVTGGPHLRRAVANAEIVHYVGHGLGEMSHQESAPGLSMSLAPGSLSRCRLAVLAACRTFDQRENLSDNVSSFAHTLLRAGAAHALATQWDVDSRMTHKLMVRFYAELADHQNFSEALRRAQQVLQSDPLSAHPYFWSAFQLVGQPTVFARGKS